MAVTGASTTATPERPLGSRSIRTGRTSRTTAANTVAGPGDGPSSAATHHRGGRARHNDRRAAFRGARRPPLPGTHESKPLSPAVQRGRPVPFLPEAMKNPCYSNLASQRGDVTVHP